MKYNIIQNNGTPHVVLFFNGWGMDERAVAKLSASNETIIHCNEYDGVLQLPSLVDDAASVTLLAWSLGVWEANRWLNQTNAKVTKAIAINGTLQPISADYGIAPDVFRGTLDGWNDANRTRFQMRMFKDRALFAAHTACLPARSCENQQTELQYFFDKAQEQSPVSPLWTKAIIGSQDLIIPTAAQLAYWENKLAVQLLPLPHYPFHSFNTWNELLEV